MSTLRNFPVPTYAHSCESDWTSGPCAISAFSSDEEFNNFTAATQRLSDLDPSMNDWDTAHFKHYSAEWVEEIFTRPRSSAEKLVEEMREELACEGILRPMPEPEDHDGPA